jgi:hypothetical protein
MAGGGKRGAAVWAEKFTTGFTRGKEIQQQAARV